MIRLYLLLWHRILHASITVKNLLGILLITVALVPTANAGVVLLYHHVSDDTPAITSISPAQFEKHLKILQAENFSVLPLDQLLSRALEGEGEQLNVAITFDDAYRSIYTTAYPMLKSLNWPFTIFVATKYVSDSNPHYLSWDQLSEMANNGVTIANHTHSHGHLTRRLPNETPQNWAIRIRAEINDAEKILFDAGFTSRLIAYPYGEYDLDLLTLIHSMDMIGFGQQSGAIGPYSNPLLLPRFPLAGVYVSENAFRDKIRSLAMPIRHPDIEPLITDNAMPPLPLSFVDETIDTDRLTCYGPGGLAALSETGPGQITATPMEEVPVGRSRYNCTLPKGNRFYWFSQLWIRKLDDGSWYAEP